MPKVSIVIPTYNESENIEALIHKLEALDSDLGIVIVDDNSPDGTADLAEEMGRKYGNITVHRRPGKLGIGSAIRNGLEIALSSPDCGYVITMDADLSHDPNDVPRLLSAAEEGNAGMIQASRYMKGGGIIGWGFLRKLQSRVANRICGMLFRLPSEVTTYFRVYTRESAQLVVDNVSADKYEFAVMSALAVKDHGLKIREVPVVFVNRTLGKSKLRTSDVLVWFVVILKIFLTRQIRRFESGRFLKFCLVGLTGVGVNEGLFALLTNLWGEQYVYHAGVIAIETSIITNFILNDIWTFRDRRKMAGRTLVRMLKYNLTCVVGVGVNLGVFALFYEVFEINHLVSYLIGIVAAVLWNYGGSTMWAWRAKRQSERGG